LRDFDPKSVDDLLAAIEVHVLTRQSRRDLVAPHGCRLGAEQELSEQDDVSLSFKLTVYTTPVTHP
jgi:hypothetical protein